MDAQRDHRHAVQPQPPGDHRDVHAERQGHLRTEQAGSAQLHPAQPRVLHVQLHGRFGEGKIRRQELDLFGLGDFPREKFQQPQQRPEIDVLPQHDAFDLEEIRRVGGVHLIVAEAARDGEIFAGRLRAGRQRAGRYGGALASQDESPRALFIEVVAPPGGTRVATVPMRRRDAGEEGFGDLRYMRRFLDEIDVVDVPRRMELRHIEGIHVPEFGLDQRPAHFLESHADQLGFHAVEEFPVGMALAGRDTGRPQADGVFPEPLRPPAAVFQEFRRQLRDFIGDTLLDERIRGAEPIRRQGECPFDVIVDPERFVGVPSFDGMLFDDAAHRFRERLQVPRRAVELLQQFADRFRSGARPSRGFHVTAGHDADRALLF